jgi:dihydroorotase
MNDLIIRNAKLVNGDITDIAVGDGKIQSVGPLSESVQAHKVVDLKGKYYVSAGWIDAHVHCFPKSPIYYDEPNLSGIATGVTTLVDAGSVGADDMSEFYAVAKQAKTNVYAFINISKIGIIAQNELSDMANIRQSNLDEMIARYPDFIIGIKARMSKSVVGENGITPLLDAKKMQKQHSQLPLMVHIGNSPPSLDDIADLLDKGDIITHCFNGKPNRILDQNNGIRESVKRAIERGVILDVGHGGESFSFNVAERAIELGVYPDVISTDIYYKNRINGPVYNIANVLAKFFCLGFSLEQIIERITVRPAQVLHLNTKGRLGAGYDADLTIFEVREAHLSLSDAEGTVRETDRQIVPVVAIVGGQCYVTQEGEAAHAINL